MSHSQDMKSPLGVAVVGCGTVGGATAQILTRDQQVLTSRIKRPIELKYIVDVNFSHAESLGLNASLFTKDFDQVLGDESVHVVVELVGGTTLAKTFIEKALNAGKHVVTANKALLAHHGPELYALARKNGVCLAFEASCAGGIPIINALNAGLITNRVDAIYGIVNGTCNFILTSMLTLGKSYADALAEAQRDGLAEADPTLDVSGGDSAHKIAIMAALAFGCQIDFDRIPTEGIDKLDLRDVRYGQEIGYVVKLLAIARRQGDGVSLCVRPAFIPATHPLAWVSGPFNAVSVYGHATGHTMYYGRGAGGLPTGSAVTSDIAGIATGVTQQTFNSLSVFPDENQPAKQLSAEEYQGRFYIRIICQDKPGVLAEVTALLAKRDISITSVLQHESHGDVVPVVVTTSWAREGDLRDALADMDALDEIHPGSVCIPIVEEHPEEL